MSSEKALALVTRVVEFSETSSVVTLFTREFGKIHALAKGSRRPKGPFESALDLLGLCRIVFLAKSSDALDLLTEAKLERRFRAATRNLSRLYAGYYVAELLNELTHDRDPHPELFDAACDTLLALGTGTQDVVALTLRFEVMALRVLGHLPALDACVECGRQVNGDGRVAFGMLAGGVLCARCRPGKKQVVSLSSGARDWLRRMAETELPESADTSVADSGVADISVADVSVADRNGTDVSVSEVGLERRIAGELRGVLNQYLSHVLGHKPRMHSYLAMLCD
jgi:DNA repair protein RecO (recombination protein O)